MERSGVREMEEEVKVIGGIEFRKCSERALPDGRYVVEIKLGDRRKARTSLWAKKLTSVDVSKKNGYAFQGEFVGAGDVAMSPRDIIVAVREFGSWKNPGQLMKVYICFPDGVYESGRLEWGTEAQNVETIYTVKRVFDELQSKEAKIEQLRTLIAEKERELMTLKKQLEELLAS